MVPTKDAIKRPGADQIKNTNSRPLSAAESKWLVLVECINQIYAMVTLTSFSFVQIFGFK